MQFLKGFSYLSEPFPQNYLPFFWDAPQFEMRSCYVHVLCA